MFDALLVSTGTVALAEIGDKTQLLALLLAARFRRPWPIIWGILLATLLNHALAGWVGTLAATWLTPDVLRWGVAAGAAALLHPGTTLAQADDVQRLVRNVPAKRAMEMLLTGDFIDARTALAQGLVNRVVAADALDAEVEKLVHSILEKPRTAVAMGKALVYQQRELGLEAAYQLAGQTMACNMMDAAAQEGARAFAEKRTPEWKR